MKRWISLGAAALSMMFLPGCWDYQGMNTRASMLGMAIDPVSEDDPEKIRITVQIPVFTGQTANTGGSNPVSQYKDITGEGDSIPEIVKSIQLKMDKNLNAAQLEALVLSSKLTQRQIDNAIGELIRDPKTNPLAYVAVAKDSASQVLVLKPAEDAPANNLNQRFMTALQHGYSVRKQLWEFWRDKTQYGMTPLLPLVYTATDETGAAEDVSINSGGAEVFPQPGKPFQLSKGQILCLNLLNGNVRNMNIDVPIPSGRVALLDIRASSRQRCFVDGSKIVLQSRISIRGTLGRQPNQTLEDMPYSNVTTFENQVARYEAEQITNTVRYLQERGADVFGFGRLYLQHYPEQEMAVKNHWDTLFQKAVPDVQVKVTITSKGLLI